MLHTGASPSQPHLCCAGTAAAALSAAMQPAITEVDITALLQPRQGWLSKLGGGQETGSKCAPLPQRTPPINYYPCARRGSRRRPPHARPTALHATRRYLRHARPTLHFHRRNDASVRQ